MGRVSIWASLLLLNHFWMDELQCDAFPLCGIIYDSLRIKVVFKFHLCWKRTEKRDPRQTNIGAKAQHRIFSEKSDYILQSFNFCFEVYCLCQDQKFFKFIYSTEKNLSKFYATEISRQFSFWSCHMFCSNILHTSCMHSDKFNGKRRLFIFFQAAFNA